MGDEQARAVRRAARHRVDPRGAIALAAAAAALLAPAHGDAPPSPIAIVVCAPGYPGSTDEARPAMEAFASAVAERTGWKTSELTAVYFETEKGGLDRLAGADAGLALVPLPFWLKHRVALRLSPRLQAIQQGGAASESWSLVARAGAVTGPASLAGFEVISLAGYAPRFVRGPALGAWGELPSNVTIAFSGAVLTGLRRASAGEKVALLLDREQAAALPTLPFAAKLQVVARSAPLPVSVLCSVGDRVPAPRLEVLLRAFTSLGASPAGADALAGVRLAKFVPADGGALARARDAFERVKE